MQYNQIHDFSDNIEKMKNIQLEIKEKLTFDQLKKQPKIISGVDLSIINGTHGLSVITTLDFNTLERLDITYSVKKLEMEYIPGFLAFRELPVFLQSWEKLKLNPDIVFFDGHGYAHPRRAGIASHASLFIDKPTVGIGKSLLVGKYEEPENIKGAYTYIYHKNEIIGAVLKTKLNVKPVFISAGNHITLQQSIDLSMQLTTKYRLPEITRIADSYTKKLKVEIKPEDLN